MTPRASHTECTHAGFEEMVATVLDFYCCNENQTQENDVHIFHQNVYIPDDNKQSSQEEVTEVKPKIAHASRLQTKIHCPWSLVDMLNTLQWSPSKKCSLDPPPYCMTKRKRLANDSWHAGLLLMRSAFTSSNFTMEMALDIFPACIYPFS